MSKFDCGSLQGSTEWTILMMQAGHVPWKYENLKNEHKLCSCLS